ncbi:TPA: 30S ribosomal protein S5 [Candidatus Poribacteria bacterium]|nr:30S ribosomal protein S5 [Candidatus Poribacteria bacterium]
MLVRKGGKTPSFNALSAVGDMNGIVGVGFGKAQEIPEAIRKSIEDARKNLIRIPIEGTTIPHDVIGHFCSSTVILKPAAPGTGVIAGSAVKVILEVAGVKDVLSKCYGARNKINIAWATMEALKELKSAEEVAALRERPLEEILARR